MRRSLIAISMLGAAATSACTDDNPGFIIQSAVALDQQCMFSVSSPSISSGSLDLALSTGDGNTQPRVGVRPYSLPLILQSRLVSRNQGTRSAPRPDAASIVVHGAVIRLLQGPPGTDNFRALDLSGGLGSEDPTEFTVPASGYVSMARDTTPGQGALLLNALPVTMTQALYDYVQEINQNSELGSVDSRSRVPIVLGIQLYGETAGGQSIESDEWYWPLDLCIGCLQGGAGDRSCTPGMNGETY